MITPPSLREGDSVSIISTARKIDAEVVNQARILLESWSLKVVLGKHLFSEENQYAGNDLERANDLQEAMNDPHCKAIFCARGGYGTMRLLEFIQFDKFSQNPKWIIGYSDITVLHAHLQRVVGVESLHGTMPVNFQTNTENSLTLLRKVLFGDKLSYRILPHYMNKQGSGRGELVGGNLSILYSLKGSVSFPNTKGRILFIEDLDEYLYHIDRMMIALKRSGCFDQLAGLIVGGMTKMNDNEVPFGKSAEEIIRDEVAGYNFPVCFGFPAGHIENNCPLILGRTVELIVSEQGCSVDFSF